MLANVAHANCIEIRNGSAKTDDIGNGGCACFKFGGEFSTSKAVEADIGDVVVTNDIPLADRVLKSGGAAIAPNGRVFSPDMIGSALASRAIGEHLRSMGEVTSGPKAFGPADRSKFLQALDTAVVKARRLAR